MFKEQIQENLYKNGKTNNLFQGDKRVKEKKKQAKDGKKKGKIQIKFWEIVKRPKLAGYFYITQ